MPAIYNENLARYNWNPPVPTPNSDEYDEQVVVNVKLENENTQLKETIMQLQNRIGAEDLTTDEMAAIQEELLDDDDDDESFLWLNGTENNIPLSVASVKVEPVDDGNDLDVLSSEGNNLEAENFDFSANVSMQQNESIREPAPSTSGSTPTSGRQPNNSVFSTMNMHNSDKVAGNVEFTLNVRIVCLFVY